MVILWPSLTYLIYITKLFFITFSLSKFNLPLIGRGLHLHDPRRSGLTEPRPVGGENKRMDHIHTFLTTQGHRGPPRVSDQPNAGVTSETAQTWKTIHTKHTLSHPNKANMEWWLRRPNDIRGPWGPNVLTFVSQVRKNPEKTSPRKPVPTEDRTRARCVISAHATTCSTAVDTKLLT